MSSEDNDDDKIRVGSYIILQRQKYNKLAKFSSIDTTVALGNEQLELRNIANKPYFTTFKMCPKEDLGTSCRGRQRLHTLEVCTDTEMVNIREAFGISASGVDNRDIVDDGDSQSLKSKDIEQLRDECSESSKIIEKIIENSKTFHAKTEYSQEKYLKKKEKKYFEFVRICKPTIRLIADIYYRQDMDKIMGIRMDTLAQIICYSGVCAFGNYLLYESGTYGLLPAALMNSIGANTEGQLVHMHPGNMPQQQALLALNLPEEQLRRCISVNIYSVLRYFHQHVLKDQKEDQAQQEQSQSVAADIEPSSKKPKLDENSEETDNHDNDPDGCNPKADDTNQSVTVSPKWMLENRRACELMIEKFDGLIIAAKEHPLTIVKELLQYVKPSRPFVIFSMIREVLSELYVDLKSTAKVANLHLSSNWMRMYQILPNRTHPEVIMHGNSGYLLIGYTVS